MKPHFPQTTVSVLFLTLLVMTCPGCTGKNNFLDSSRMQLKAVKIDPPLPGEDDPFQEIDPEKPDKKHPFHSMFYGSLGRMVDPLSMSAVALDDSGYSAVDDYDGDGIPNDIESAGFTNPYVADYPRITTRIDTPVTMELRVSEDITSENHAEEITDNDVSNTINNCMDSKHYNKFNLKTTPYETKDSESWSNKLAGSTGYTEGTTVGVSVVVMGFGGGVTTGYSSGQNQSWDLQLSRSTSSENMTFEDVDYVDNLNRSGVEYRNDTIERVSRNYRQSAVSKSDFVIKPNAGIVRAGLYLANESLNQPVHISHVECTLSFRTPSGKCLHAQSFFLNHSDNSEFDVDIYGGQELGPFTVEVDKLNTFEIKNALRNGYIPQIHIVSYDMGPVEDTNYNPGVENLMMAEQTVKSRTALIKIVGPGLREIYRVPAFEVNEEGMVSPGVSLKKALFYILHKRVGDAEIWDDEVDGDGQPLTVKNVGLKWKYGYTGDPDQYQYTANTTGNNWDDFETYVKEYEDIENYASGNINYKTKRIETIKRIGNLQKFNPFCLEDNPSYDPNKTLTSEEFLKLKQWVILYNGTNFKGDINDPIWAGERYEIIFYNASDVQKKAESFYSAPLQNVSEQDITTMTGGTTTGGSSSGSGSSSDNDPNEWQFSALQAYSDFTINTLWNREYENKSKYSRARFLGKVSRGEVVKLEVELDEFRSLFNIDQPGREFKQPVKIKNIDGRIWEKFNYTLDEGVTLSNGIPRSFTYLSWGGCNQLVFNICESVNAHSYTISFWPQGQSPENAKKINILPQDLSINNGYIVINSKTLDTQGFEVGHMQAGVYNVRVLANGVVNNVPKSTSGTTENTSLTVTDPPENGLPSDFTMSVTGMVSGISIVVNQSENAEYYLGDITGPYNYGHGNGVLAEYTPPTKRVVLHQGKNIIAVPKSDPTLIGNMIALTDDELAWAVPGVYQVKVYAVNSNCLDAGGLPDPLRIISAQSNDQGVMVDYNRYEMQKLYRPKPQIEQFNPKDVDFEVNFGEGSGWFRLKISHDDYTDLKREIDCRMTTNFSENRGRVTIYFTPPAGNDTPQNTDYNVFRGGVEQVEVYLRTVARSEYRDSIWLKSSDKDAYDPFNVTGYRGININSEVNVLPGYDPLKYWIMNDYTDATMIEYYKIGSVQAEGRVFSSFESGYSVLAGDFGVVAAGGIDDFFFSPMKMLSYKVSASVADANLSEMMGEMTYVDTPEYRPLGGEQKIMLSNLDSQYADSYEIGWKTKKSTADAFKIDTILANDDYHAYEINRVITNGIEQNLMTNTEYLVYIMAKREDTHSQKIYMTVKTMPEARAYPLIDPVSLSNGYGIFISGTQPITDDSGSVFVNGVNFQYDQPLNNPLGWNIFDSGTSGALADGRLLRIVEGGRNITTYLTPVAKNLSGIVYAPPMNKCYIDPAHKSFVFPRPSYWSKMDNDAAVDLSPSIREEVPVWTRPAEATFSMFKPGCMWSGSCYYLDDNGGAALTALLYPFGNTTVNYDSGTVSVWIKPTANTYFNIAFGGSTAENRVQMERGKVSIYVNNSQVATVTTTTTAVFHHLYVVWDKNGLGNGYRIKAIYDGSTEVNWAGDWNPTGGLCLYSKANASAGGIWVDNIKVWKEVVSLTSDWDYNAGTGREDSLHLIYGSANSYRPALTGPNGVGYYTVPMW